MKILVHDFGGYPFPVELSRELAGRGHEVMHAFCGSIKTTPGGDHEMRPEDPPSLTILPVLLPQTLNKYSFVKRWRQERHYGMLIAEVVKKHRPDIVISANTPLDAQCRLQSVCRKLNIPFVFWLQDVLSVAADRLLRKKKPLLGWFVGKHYLRLEGRLLRNSDLSVLITEDFIPLTREWGVDENRIRVIENWAPLQQLPLRTRGNHWANKHGLEERRCIVYTGTMGMKHNPNLLLQLAIALRNQPDCRVVVVSEGLGADWLKEKTDEHDLSNLIVLDYGPFEQVPDVMATADILVAILEPDAGLFSVPSKVLAYLCSQRPILLAVPTNNLSARIVRSQNAGVIVEPEDIGSFTQQAIELLNDSDRRSELGRNGRRYAEEHFVIESIADKFEEGIREAMDRSWQI